MPMYEYECDKCGEFFEDIAGADAPCPQCPKCSGETRKVISSPSIRVEFASPIDRGAAPLVGYNPTGRKPTCPGSGGGCSGCG